jgi:hypothetical protein
MTRSIASIFLLPAVLATASCGILDQPEPIFGDHQTKYILGDHRPDQILPGDAITSDKQAIQLAMKNCPPAKRDTDPGFWEAHIEGNTWVVYFEHNAQSVTAKINKSNGAFEDCKINEGTY